MVLCIVIFLTLIGLIDYRLPLLSFWDELLLAVIGLLYFGTRRRGRISRGDFSQFGLLLAILIVGFLGNAAHPGYQTSRIAMIKDIVAFVKFPLLLIMAPAVFPKRIHRREEMLRFAKLYISCLFAFACVGYFINLGVYINDKTRQLKTFEFYYSHCTFMVSSVLCLVALLIKDSPKRNKLYIILGCFVMMMSQRTKAFVISGVILLILIVGTEKLSLIIRQTASYSKAKKKYLIPICIIFVIAAWFVSKDRIDSYWKYGVYAARPALYIIGLKLAMHFFPIGSGLATFASSLSGEYYSGVYHAYGIDKVIGLTLEDYSYIADAYYPYVYGQFGIMGFLLYAVLIYRSIKTSIRQSKDYNTVAALAVMWIYIIFACSAETLLTNSTGAQMAVFIAVLSMDFKGCLSSQHMRGSMNTVIR